MPDETDAKASALARFWGEVGPPTASAAAEIPGLDLFGPAAVLLNPHVVDNRVYKNDLIDLDGYTFRNCAFIGCLLKTSKGNFQIISCHFDSCRVYFSGNSLKAVKLSSLLLGSGEQFGEALRAHRAADGGITI